jgi:hypothetical protein
VQSCYKKNQEDHVNIEQFFMSQIEQLKDFGEEHSIQSQLLYLTNRLYNSLDACKRSRRVLERHIYFVDLPGKDKH